MDYLVMSDYPRQACVQTTNHRMIARITAITAARTTTTTNNVIVGHMTD